jgi:hypothetical protein
VELCGRVLELMRSYHLEAMSRAELERLRDYLHPPDLAEVEEFLACLEGRWHPAETRPTVRLARAPVAALGAELDFVDAAYRWVQLPAEALARKVRLVAEAADEGCEARTAQGAALLEKIRAAVREGARFAFDDPAAALPEPDGPPDPCLLV